MGSIQISSMSWSVPGNRGASLFSRRAHLLTTPKGRWYFLRKSCALRGGLRRLRTPLDKAAFLSNCQPCPCSRQGGPFWKPLFMGWYIATPSRRLPVSTCHRQLDTDTGVEQIVPPLLVVRRISRRTERKQWCPVSGHPFQKGQGDLWQFIIWRPRWSAVEPGAPPWLLRPI